MAKRNYKRKPVKKRTTRKKPVRKTAKTKSPRLGYYLLAGLFVIFVMWLLIRNPVPAPQELEERVAHKREKIKERYEAVAKAAKRSKQEEQDEEIELIIHQKPEKEEGPSLVHEGESEIDLVIRRTADEIGVPVSAVRRRKRDERVSFSIPIDRSQMDLTYANMIFKGKMEMNAAKFVKGQDSRTKQSLLFSHKNTGDQYEIDLYYDNKLYQKKASEKTITIVIDDFGDIGGKLLEGFFALDPEVCFAIFPDAPYTDQTVRLANRQGRDYIIHVPMEPIGYPKVNPGKNAILAQHNEAQVRKILGGHLAKMPQSLGINNHMGSLATSDPQLMQSVINVLKDHGKLFLDSRTTNVSVAYQTAQKSSIKAFRNDLFLDSPNISQSTMNSKLSQINRLADSKRHVIAITHCHSIEKLEYLKEIIRKLKSAGFTLIPLSELDQRNIPEII